MNQMSLVFFVKPKQKGGNKKRPKGYIIESYDDSFIVLRRKSIRNIINKRACTLKIKDTQDPLVCIDEVLTVPLGLKLSPISIFSVLLGNAGGNSDISEMMSIEYYIRSCKATNFLFETEIQYYVNYKMVDYICDVDGRRVGVSVTRAMGYPRPEDFTYARALRLLHKKLYGLIVARNAVCKKQSFKKSILHVWSQNLRIAKLIKKAYSSFSINDYGLDIKGFVILHITVCKDSYIYTNKFSFQ